MSGRVTLGGYVIHGNSAATLDRCLDSLTSVCDEVATIDSESTDGSRAIAERHGAHMRVVPWQGFGFARVAALDLLPATDYVMFLDSDEWLDEPSRAAIRAWRDAGPDLPQYTVTRRDWATLDARRFLFRRETRVRLIRRDAATWKPSMVVHESLPRRASQKLSVFVEHDFARSATGLAEKQRQYAFLWAVRAFGEGKRSRATLGRRVVHLLRNALLKGAAFRGGFAAIRLAWAVAAYHVDKYRYLAALERGEAAAAVAAWREARYADLFTLARDGEHRRLLGRRS